MNLKAIMNFPVNENNKSEERSDWITALVTHSKTNEEISLENYHKKGRGNTNHVF